MMFELEINIFRAVDACSTLRKIKWALPSFYANTWKKKFHTEKIVCEGHIPVCRHHISIFVWVGSIFASIILVLSCLV